MNQTVGLPYGYSAALLTETQTRIFEEEAIAWIKKTKPKHNNAK